jgi:hypothetical protein
MEYLILWTIHQPVLALLSLMGFYIILFTAYNQRRFKRLAEMFKYPFAIYDTLVNVTAMSILMVDLPQEYTVTSRLKRYKAAYAGKSLNPLEKYRYGVAKGLCWLANRFDEGHC